MAIRSASDLKRLTETRRSILVYIAIAYAQSLALSLMIGLTGGYRSRWIGLGYLSMLIPAISVQITKAAMREKQGSTGWRGFSLRYLPLALFLMPLVMHAAMLPVAAALGTLRWEDWLTTGADGLYHTPPARGWGILTPAGLAERIALNAIAGLIVVSALALFEEVGWRGWLLPRLIDRMTKSRAVMVTSVVWAIWHVPYALAGIQHLDGVPAGWAALVVPLGIFGSGLIIGWLWLRTESIWIAAIAHGALNNWGQYAFKFTSGAGQSSDVLVLGSGGLALIVAGTLLLLFEDRNEKRSDPITRPGSWRNVFRPQSSKP
jgi:membrane protease YdiL (CAAX protease family)